MPCPFRRFGVLGPVNAIGGRSVGRPALSAGCADRAQDAGPPPGELSTPSRQILRSSAKASVNAALASSVHSVGAGGERCRCAIGPVANSSRNASKSHCKMMLGKKAVSDRPCECYK